MKYAYTLTEHAKKRLHERRISPWDALRALERRPHLQCKTVAHHFDPKSRVVVVVNPERHTVVTLFRADSRMR